MYACLVPMHITFVHAYIHTNMHTHMRITFVHAYIHTDMYITFVHAYIQTNMHTDSGPRSKNFGHGAKG